MGQPEAATSYILKADILPAGLLRSVSTLKGVDADADAPGITRGGRGRQERLR